MGINVTNMTPSQAKAYYYDYNNGNKEGLSEAEYASICTKFRDYISAWEQDENAYSTTETPEERLDYDEGDAGFFTSDGKGALTMTEMTASLGMNAISQFATGGSLFLPLNFKVGGNYVQGLLLIAAAMQFATAKILQKNSPNKDAAAACENAQEELYTEQAILADQVLDMEEMQEEMLALQEEANAVNEQGQSDILTMEGLYNYYYTKYQAGNATESEIAKMNALSSQMQAKQTSTSATTLGLNEEIVAVGENYEVITKNVETTNNFTEYVSEFDAATKRSSNASNILLNISAVSSLATAAQCAYKAGVFSGSFALSWMAAIYIAAGVMAGRAAMIFHEQAKNQSDFADIADNTIEIREDTQSLSAETTEFQEVSTEFWAETVEATNAENLFTLTPTYAMQPVLSSNVAETSTTTQPTAATQTQIAGTNPFAQCDDDKEKGA